MGFRAWMLWALGEIGVKRLRVYTKGDGCFLEMLSDGVTVGGLI